MNVLLSLLRKLGFYISYSKLVCPSTSLTFLGIDINTNQMTIALPSDKLEELQETLLKFPNAGERLANSCNPLQGSSIGHAR